MLWRTLHSFKHTQLISHPVHPPWRFQNNGSAEQAKQLCNKRAEVQSVPQHLLFLANLNLDKATYVYVFCVTAPHLSFSAGLSLSFIFHLSSCLSLFVFISFVSVSANYVAAHKRLVESQKKVCYCLFQQLKERVVVLFSEVSAPYKVDAVLHPGTNFHLNN